jgi:GDPmannose 4,6-dehydratase
MWKMLQEEVADDYVIATGETHSVQEFVQLAFSSVGISDWNKYVKTSDKFLRPAEVDFLVGDASKARNQLNWKPVMSFPDLVELMVQSDLKMLSKK